MVTRVILTDHLITSTKAEQKMTTQVASHNQPLFRPGRYVRKFFRPLACLFVCVPALALAAIPEPNDIDTMANDTLQEWDIPGMAVAIVHKGKDVAVTGYGVQQRGGSNQVNEETLFQIASLSKAFTAATIGTLVDQGKLQWERPIKGYLPEFQLKDPVATEEMTLRDLLSHRTGLPGTSKDCWRLWHHTERSTEEILRRLAFVDPAYPFRSHLSYNNVAYQIAAVIAERTSGTSWPTLVEQRIFSPLGMKRTHMSYSRLINDTNVASPHLLRSIREKPISWANWEALSAAGGINTCAKDMALWLKYCLTSPAPLQEAFRSQTIMEPEGLLNPIALLSWPVTVHEQKIIAYGYGWGMYSLANRTILFHTGLAEGMQSICAIVPDEELGIAIFTNQEGHFGIVTLLNSLLDRFLNQPSVSWNKKAREAGAEMAQAAKAVRTHLEAERGKKSPSFPPAQYVGHYEHPAYGSIWIRSDKDRLVIELWTHEKGVLQPWNGDRFEVTEFPSDGPLPLLIDFVTKKQTGQIVALSFPKLGVFQKQST